MVIAVKMTSRGRHDGEWEVGSWLFLTNTFMCANERRKVYSFEKIRSIDVGQRRKFLPINKVMI